MYKLFKKIYFILCCRCTSCILYEEIESGILDTPEKIKARKIELKNRW